MKPVTKRNEKDDNSKTETDIAYGLMTSGNIIDSFKYKCEVCEPEDESQAQNDEINNEIETPSKKEPHKQPERNFALILSGIYSEKLAENNKEKWIGDSGATVHITNNDIGMVNIRECNLDITVGNDETVKC